MPSATVASLIGRKYVDYVVMRPNDALVLPSCLVGVEMELEGDTRGEAMHLNHTPHMVTAKEDGSLRNGGIEMIFSSPLMGDAVIDALKWMFKVKADYNLVGSTRTSTHMHINYTASTDTADTLIKSLVAWLLVEKAACLTAGHHREYNSFCVPTYMMQPREENIVYNLAAADPNDSYALNDHIHALSNTDRYCAMNLSALFKYGTLECRLLGTADYQQTLDWLNILLSVKKAAMDYTRDELLSYSTLAEFLAATMPVAAELLVTGPAAEEQYTTARSGMLAMLNNKTPTTTTLTGVYFNESEWPSPEQPSDAEEAGSFHEDTPVTVAEYDDGAIEQAIINAVLDDQWWATNDVLGSDYAGWSGPDLLRNEGFNFSAASEVLRHALLPHTNYSAAMNGDADYCVNKVAAVLMQHIPAEMLVRSPAAYAMRYFNLLGRFAVVARIAAANRTEISFR